MEGNVTEQNSSLGCRWGRFLLFLSFYNWWISPKAALKVYWHDFQRSEYLTPLFHSTDFKDVRGGSSVSLMGRVLWMRNFFRPNCRGLFTLVIIVNLWSKWTGSPTSFVLGWVWKGTAELLEGLMWCLFTQVWPLTIMYPKGEDLDTSTFTCLKRMTIVALSAFMSF